MVITMLNEFVSEHKVLSSVATGYTIYYLISFSGELTGYDMYLILTFSALSYVYFKTDTFGGMNK